MAVKVGGISEIRPLDPLYFLSVPPECVSFLIQLAQAFDWFMLEHSIGLEEVFSENSPSGEDLRNGTSQVLDRIKEQSISLVSLFHDFQKAVETGRALSSLEETRQILFFALQLIVAITACLLLSDSNCRHQALFLYYKLQLFHWMLYQPYEAQACSASLSRTAPTPVLPKESQLVSFAHLSLNGEVPEERVTPLLYMDHLLASSPLESDPWALFLGILSSYDDDYMPVYYGLFQQLTDDKQWNLMKSLILRIIELREEAVRYFNYILSPSEMVLHHFLGLCYLHLGNPSRSSLCFKKVFLLFGGFFFFIARFRTLIF